VHQTEGSVQPNLDVAARTPRLKSGSDLTL
jgi:hypothetical protein